MSDRKQRIIDLTATVAAHKRAGNLANAERMQSKLDMYAEITDREYLEYEIAVMAKSNFPALRRAADRMAAELLGAA